VQNDPHWVADKAYYPVVFDNQRREWVPCELTEQRVLQSSIIPTAEQRARFEASPAYLKMIFQVCMA
jgi:hypothetical protein